ncbi:GNAT family N-acetyltransferase [Bombilactobacillus folatiphilus]|uniref:GNAT family N-acetyltransferase n=1 Tax=Bombilactobacillus folatiphilus TaxID=2923362 RepID=A0ABY4P8U8_9LACO|nr:GNAT family N-acetyltransferase [Bombilactobacillus folatiphilus]UQS82035.1 GNAT family N-acetyltransferase [Bombilactobacillus folatiphilus]
MKITFRLAQQTDLHNIVKIYNQSVITKTITADFIPLKIEQRQAWFQEHNLNPLRPLWVILNEQQSVIGWVSLSDFYGRPAYQATSEISIYFDQDFQHQGFGQQTLDFVFSKLLQCQITTVLAIIFSTNNASQKLFAKNQFQHWGHLPDVAQIPPKMQPLSMEIWGRHF